jgi:AcrR family transcriptional regulator
LAAASAEFVRAGYGAATIRAIADAAGVSVPTVELVFGTKSKLLRAAISFAIRGDADPTPMLQREWAATAEAAASAPRFLAIVGSVLSDAAQRSAGLVVAAFEAANADESMRALADELRAQRAETAAWIVDGSIERSPMRSGITREHAIDIVWLLMDPHGYCALTRHRGWTSEQFGRWFADSVSRLLLANRSGARGRSEPPTTHANPRSKREAPR